MCACAAENRRSTWYTGEEHTKSRDYGKIKRDTDHVRLGKDVSADSPGKGENEI